MQFLDIAGLQTLATRIDTRLSTKQDSSNLVTSISSTSTDSQYPSAKCMYDILGNIDQALTEITNL